MSLPKISVITHSTVIPSTKQEITIRPFLVKEQKILLTAVTGQNNEDMVQAIKQIVNNCIVFPKIDVDKLELFDLEYLILQLRIISVGESTKIRFKGREGVTCLECLKPREVDINLKEATVDLSNIPEKKIQLTDTVGIVMKYPTAKILNKMITENSENLDEIFKIVWTCVDYVYDEDKITSAKDVGMKEALEFLESLSSEQFTKIENFISSMPKLTQKINIKCSKCDFEEDFILTGLDNFFG